MKNPFLREKRYCYNCKYFKNDSPGVTEFEYKFGANFYDKCTHPKVKYTYCDLERSDGTIMNFIFRTKTCNASGSRYEPNFNKLANILRSND